jgi:uncharacterized OB-fold protein
MDAEATARPVPNVDRVSAPYWKAAAAGRLMLQWCPRCCRYQFYPRTLCKYCLNELLEWREVSGHGSVYSFTVVHMAPEPSFATELPYILALVELDEGPRLLSSLVDCSHEGLTFGLPVRAVFDRLREDVALPRFRPLTR